MMLLCSITAFAGECQTDSTTIEIIKPEGYLDPYIIVVNHYHNPKPKGSEGKGIELKVTPIKLYPFTEKKLLKDSIK